jgi:osmotically-inducible protein OsmY
MRNLNAEFQATYHSLLAFIHARQNGKGTVPARDRDRAPGPADEQLRHDVDDELRYDPALHAGSVHVEVNQGAVTLTGTTENSDENTLIEAAAWRIAGVTSLSNKLDIPAASMQPMQALQDDDIRKACEEALKSLKPQSDYAAAVSISSGWVMLSGTVLRGSQRWAAEEVVSRVPGVKGVNGQLTIRPVVMQSAVRGNIAAALGNMDGAQRPDIDLVIKRRRVLVKGTVHSPEQYRAVLNAVRSTEGVDYVLDQVDILPG